MLDKICPSKIKIRLRPEPSPQCCICHNTNNEYLSILNVPMCTDCEAKLVSMDCDNPHYLEYMEKLKNAFIQ